MPSVKVELNDELAEKIESETLDSGRSRQKIIQDIIEKHYSLVPLNDNLVGLDVELRHTMELLEASKRENEILQEYLDTLRGISVLIMTKQLLPAGAQEKRKTWWTRFKNALFGH